MEKKRYNLELLNSFVKDNKVEIIGNYENVNRDTKISGKCLNSECEDTFCKSFTMLINKGGPYCEKCTKLNMVKKVKQTCSEKYNCEYPMQSELIKEKSKQTCLRNNNCEYPMQSNTIKEKSKQSCLKKYKVEHPMQTGEVKERSKQTCLENHGVKNPSQCKKIKDKKKETCLRNHGVEHPSQNSEICEKQLKNSFNKKEYILPSGKILQVQGFENLSLDILIYNENIDENDLMLNRSEVPEIWYEYNGKYHRYYVDIFIKSLNKCIEVKSEYTFNTNKKINLLKHKYLKYNGYNSEIWIFDDRKTLIKVIQ